MRLSHDQVTEALARLSPAAKLIAMVLAKSPEERERIRDQVIKVPSSEVAETQFAAVEQRLKEAPPVRFDIARQVHVFESYLQYVELHLSGVAIQRHRIAIPKNIQSLGGDEGGLLARTARERFSVNWGLAESGATGPAGKRYGDPAGHIARSSADLFPALLQFIFPRSPATSQKF